MGPYSEMVCNGYVVMACGGKGVLFNRIGDSAEAPRPSTPDARVPF